jgi:hypothetical protein
MSVSVCLSVSLCLSVLVCLSVCRRPSPRVARTGCAGRPRPDLESGRVGETTKIFQYFFQFPNLLEKVFQFFQFRN